MELRTKLIIDISTSVDDKNSNNDTLKYLVEDDLSDSNRLNYKVHSCEIPERIIDIKERIAKNHGFEANILGTRWKFAMLVTSRTKKQIQMYEELVKALANES